MLLEILLLGFFFVCFFFMSHHASVLCFSPATEAGVMQLDMPDVRFSHVPHVFLQQRALERVKIAACVAWLSEINDEGGKPVPT